MFKCNNAIMLMTTLIYVAAEALHLAHLLAAHGYIFPIDDHVLTVKPEGTFYRFQVKELIFQNGDPNDF